MSWQQPSSTGAPWPKESKTRTPNSGKGQGGVGSLHRMSDLPGSPRTIPVLALQVPHSWKPHMSRQTGTVGHPDPQRTACLSGRGPHHRRHSRAALGWEVQVGGQSQWPGPRQASEGGTSGIRGRSQILEPRSRLGEGQAQKGQRGQKWGQVSVWWREGGSFRVKKCKSRCCQSGSTLR